MANENNANLIYGTEVFNDIKGISEKTADKLMII